ncbi:hypothetical protein NIES4105_47280 [Calothrix sp. NIES-4105]|nr:hypothetical protein NIES4105_47280 [Calothrix sp. NIES-4105]
MPPLLSYLVAGYYLFSLCPLRLCGKKIYYCTGETPMLQDARKNIVYISRNWGCSRYRIALLNPSCVI